MEAINILPSVGFRKKGSRHHGSVSLEPKSVTNPIAISLVTSPVFFGAKRRESPFSFAPFRHAAPVQSVSRPPLFVLAPVHCLHRPQCVDRNETGMKEHKESSCFGERGKEQQSFPPCVGAFLFIQIMDARDGGTFFIDSSRSCSRLHVCDKHAQRELKFHGAIGQSGLVHTSLEQK